MDRKEALEFLELPEFASPEEIKAKLDAKLAYFEMLSEKAPSQFVRKLHARNVAKIKEIMFLARSWPTAPAPVYTTMVTIPEMIQNVPAPPPPPAAPEPVAAAPEPIAAAPEPAAPSPEPVIPAPPPQPAAKPTTPTGRTIDVTRPVRPVQPSPAPAADEPLAWLVRHTENQSPDTFPIHAGKNYIGRKEKPGTTPFIMVKDDPYISKVHAVVIAEPGSPATFYLADDPATNGDKASTNGTYLNGDGDRITTKTRIRNNDTIQVGVTKLILRYNDNALERILKEVAGKDYVHTVIIDVL